MLSGIEVTKAALDDFKKIQDYMISAKKENAVETYAKLKKVSDNKSIIKCFRCESHRHRRNKRVILYLNNNCSQV